MTEDEMNEITMDAIHAVRVLLKTNDVPGAAFIDDHVGHAIAQRNKLRDALIMIAHKFPETRDMVAAGFVEAHLKHLFPAEES